MKKLLLIFLLISGFAFGQKAIAIVKAKEYFKNDYVLTNFKNPYSYKFKSAYAIDFTVEDEINDAIDDLNYKIEHTDTIASNFDRELFDKTKQTKNRLVRQYLDLTPTQKKTVVKYNVFLQCYGKNSFGNSVFQEYLITVLENHSENKWEIQKVLPWK